MSSLRHHLFEDRVKASIIFQIDVHQSAVSVEFPTVSVRTTATTASRFHDLLILVVDA